MRGQFSFILFLFGLNCAIAQNEKIQHLSFLPSFGNLTLTPDRYYKLNDTDSVKIESLKFYISGIELLNSEEIVWKEKNSYHLLDFSNHKSLDLSLNIPEELFFSKIRFRIGIDSTTNVSGAFGGDLDPTRGMYWAWQSGYINFKLEGKSNLCNARNNEFQFHLGGYQFPFSTIQTVNFEVSKNKGVNINVDIKKMLAGVNFSRQNHIMSPGKEAVLLSEIVFEIFQLRQ